MKESLTMISSKAKEGWYIIMEIIIKGNSSRIRKMEKGLIITTTNLNMKEIGKMIKLMASER